MEIEVEEEFGPALRKRADEKGFSGVEEYVNYVLGQIASEVEVDDSEYSEKEEEDIKQKLEDLGYDPS